MAAKDIWRSAITGGQQAICSSAIILLAVSASVNLILPVKAGFSVFAGGVIAAVNFILLALTLRKGIAVDKERIKGFIAARYWIRFGIIAAIISYLISKDAVNPLAFVFGFTLVMLNIFLMLFVKKEGF